ncbi:MAG: choice-of-anchor D domain-containing protein [Proteobacteria bacterium]|nr:choice-of-anchor D domain-containing protein [Pseudomonadota bacterium]
MRIFFSKHAISFLISLAILTINLSLYSYGAELPTISSVTPSSGFNDLNTTIQITGTNFQSDAKVDVGTTSAIDVTVISSTIITATVPYGITAGTYDVKVTNSLTYSATFVNGFVVNSPPAEWTSQTLTWTGGVGGATTSTCTLVLPNNTYRMYNPGIGFRSSEDGLTWPDSTNTNINEMGATNPAVITLKDGTYLMIYGIQQHTSGPPTERQYRATSTDGIYFNKEPTDAVLTGENDFASVPDLIYINDDTTLRLYYVSDSLPSHIHTATSIDDGLTWIKEGLISITGGPIGQQDVDPDIIKLADGTYRLFFATPPVDQSELGDLRIRSAVSTDGRNFTLESGSRIIPSPSEPGAIVIDPDTVLLPGTTDKYQFYYGGMISDTPQVLRVAVPRFPDISVSPDSHDFGNVSIGSTSTAQTFTITNTDTDTALVISTITLAGIDPSEFSIQNETCTAQPIPQSGTCTCQVTFSPASASAKSVILRIQSNDPDTPTKDISLTGTGTAETTCTSWSDVIAEYNKYVSGNSTWSEVINIYNQYVTKPC